MSWIMTCGRSNVENFSMSPWSSCGERGELGRLEAEFEGQSVCFDIIDDIGGTLISGRYFGADRDRDWPLQSARIHASRSTVEPVRVEYEDGVIYAFDDQLNDIVQSQ